MKITPLNRFLYSTYAVATFFLFSLPGFSQDLQARLEWLQPIRMLHVEQRNVGFVFVMSHNGKMVLEDFAGTADLQAGIAIEKDSRFSVMSVTKAFTGAILAKAIVEKQVDLDLPVSQYLPSYQGEGKNKITLRMLATHTAGIPHLGHPQRKALYVEHFNSAREAVTAFEDKPLKNPPGKGYHYSSSGYNLIAAILETVYGRDIQTLASEFLFVPLKLENTGYLNVQRPIKNMVRNYSFVDLWTYQPTEVLQQIPTWDFSYNFGGGNMYSTAHDLVRFGEAVLSGRIGKAQQTLLTKPLWPTERVSRWTLGWITSITAHGRNVVYITGATPGVQASLYLYPQENIVFAMLANSWGENSAGGALVIDAPQEVVERYLKDTK